MVMQSDRSNPMDSLEGHKLGICTACNVVMGVFKGKPVCPVCGRKKIKRYVVLDLDKARKCMEVRRVQSDATNTPHESREVGAGSSGAVYRGDCTCSSITF